MPLLNDFSTNTTERHRQDVWPSECCPPTDAALHRAADRVNNSLFSSISPPCSNNPLKLCPFHSSTSTVRLGTNTAGQRKLSKRQKSHFSRQHIHLESAAWNTLSGNMTQQSENAEQTGKDAKQERSWLFQSVWCLKFRRMKDGAKSCTSFCVHLRLSSKVSQSALSPMIQSLNYTAELNICLPSVVKFSWVHKKYNSLNHHCVFLQIWWVCIQTDSLKEVRRTVWHSSHSSSSSSSSACLLSLPLFPLCCSQCPDKHSADSLPAADTKRDELLLSPSYTHLLKRGRNSGSL